LRIIKARVPLSSSNTFSFCISEIFHFSCSGEILSQTLPEFGGEIEFRILGNRILFFCTGKDYNKENKNECPHKVNSKRFAVKTNSTKL
jgi:hypothetical protein